MSGSRRNTKRTFTPQDKRSFYLVGSDLFLGLVFASTQNYTYKINRTLVSTPTFLFYDSQTKVIIDYSNSKNTDDLSFVSAFFNSLSAGITFTFQTASYVEDGVQVKSDLSGTYSFDKFEQGKVVKANVVSTTNISSKKDLYLPKFFTNTPQLSKASGSVSSTQQRTNIIKNTLSSGLFSFKRLGLRIGDYVDFSGTENNKWNKMKVLDIFTDTDGFEVIEVDRELTDENLIGSPVLVNIYFEGEPATDGMPDEKTYGTCVVRFAAGASVCFPCQNKFQCDERAKQLNGISSIYTENTTCDDTEIQTITATPIPVTAGITGATEFTVINGTTQQVVNGLSTVSKKINLQLINLSYENGALTDEGTSLENYSLGLVTNLKVVLTNPNLSGYTFVFSSTNPTSKITEITDNIIKSGTPGKSNSYISIQSGSTPQTIYLTSTDRKLILPITVK